MSKDRSNSNKYFLFKRDKKSRKRRVKRSKTKKIIIKLNTLNSGKARRDDKIVSTVINLGKIQ